MTIARIAVYLLVLLSCFSIGDVTNCPASFVDVQIRSRGCDDAGKPPNRCGFSYIKVNGTNYSPHKRGHNLVIVDAKTGAVLESKHFNTNERPNSGYNLRNYLDAINGNKIVLVATQNDGSQYVTPALDALRRLGATDPILVTYRGSYALAGYAQPNKPDWITQVQRNRYMGPSMISMRIPLIQTRYGNR